MIVDILVRLVVSIFSAFVVCFIGWVCYFFCHIGLWWVSLLFLGASVVGIWFFED